MERLILRSLTIKSLFGAFFCIFLSSNSIAQIANFIKPDGIVLQHAGSIGFMSAGVQYHLFKQRGNLEFLYGYVPKSKGGDLNILSMKFVYKPFKIKYKDLAVIYPFNPGAFVSYQLRKGATVAWTDDPYEEQYYWWSTVFRPHLSFSAEIKLNALKIMPGTTIQNIGIYSEFNFNELSLASWYKNPKTKEFRDILKLGLGARIYF